MDRTQLLLKSHNYFKGLPDEIIDDFAQHVHVIKYQTGDIVHDCQDSWNDIYFIVEGRVKVVKVGKQGLETLFGVAEQGDQMGMISTALPEPIPMRALAIEPSILLQVNQERAFDISAKYPALRRHWRSRLAGAFAKTFLQVNHSTKTRIVTGFHGTNTTRHLTNDLVHELDNHIKGKVGLITDFSGGSIPKGVCVYRIDSQPRLDMESLFQKLSEWRDVELALIDLDSGLDIEAAIRICSLSEHIIWWLNLDDREREISRIQSLTTAAEGFREKNCAVWLLGEEIVSPVDSQLDDLVSRQFKISHKVISGEDNLAPTIHDGMARLVNYLRGIQVGLALGGGAARGMAHLGVLKALEEAGIVIDRIAGTSAGAMVGSLYAWGLSADFMKKQFALDLKPSWFFRIVPKGLYWNLLYKYRTGRFGPMLRKYIGTASLQQLQIPSATIAVDLVRGDALVRDRGEVVNSILESINLPVLSVPMMNQDTALIDGGFINNVPADVLVQQGCNIVIAVDVLSKMEKEFLKIRPGDSPQKNASPNFLQTYMRIYAIQNSKLTTSGIRAADVTIEPDLSDFSLAAFTKAEEMAKIGKAAAEEKIPDIKSLIASLEMRLQRPVANRNS